MEEAIISSTICCDLQVHRLRPSTVASHRNVAWIAAEERDVLLYPVQSLSLIFEAVVDAAVRKNLLTSKETPPALLLEITSLSRNGLSEVQILRSNSVVKVHDHNVHPTSLNQSTPIVISITVRVKATTLNEEIDR